MADTYIVYLTTDDEREAEETAVRLWKDHGRRAIVHSVHAMHVLGMSDAPRTSDRYAVLAEPEPPRKRYLSPLWRRR